MKNLYLRRLLVALITAGGTWCSSAFALPYLQLDVGGGSYDPSLTDPFKQDSVASGNPFDLYGLIDTGYNKYSEDSKDYRISIALLKTNGDSVANGTNFGSFIFAGTSYAWNDANLKYGLPPVDALNDTTKDGNNDLETHGVYSTSYFEVNVNNLIAADTMAAYNVQDDPTIDPAVQSINTDGALKYFKSAVNITNLMAGYLLHFDFYTVDSSNNVVNNAPYSHDARSLGGTCTTNCGGGGGGGGGGGSVPEPSIVALLGIGLLGMGISKVRRQI